MYRILSPFIAIIFLASCGPIPLIQDPYVVDTDRQKENIYYIPSTPNTPMSSKKDHLDFNLNYSSGTRYSGMEFRGGYLPSKHIGIIAGYSVAAHNALLDYMDYNRFELGAGYITEISDEWHFETYAGAGSGKINNRHHTGYSNIKLNHYFLQPAFIYKNPNKTFELGIISRFAGVNFSVRDTSFNTDREKYSSSQLTGLYDKPFHIMWEPALIARAGWKNFKFSASYTMSSDLTESTMNRSNNNLSLGIALQFNAGKKK